MNAVPPAARFDGSFSCVAAAWQAHGGELGGFLQHQGLDEHAASSLN